MKLFSKYNRINLLFTVAIFIVGSITFCLLIRYIVNNQTDNDLLTEKEEITSYVTEHNALPEIENTRGEYTTYKLMPTTLRNDVEFFTDKRWNAGEHDYEPVRSIKWNMTIHNKSYLITVSKSLDVTEDLVQSIIVITIALILLILITSLLVNRVILRRLWLPFYQSMEVVQKFKLNDAGEIQLEKSKIDEFDLMNTTLKYSLNKAHQDYHSLKQFTENASHELQTPLAIISSKLDIMIQSEELTETQSEAISGAYEAVKSLKKLNKSLLLLAKIENGQFEERNNIDLLELVAEKKKQFKEQWQYKNIEIKTDLQPATLYGNKQLTDILLNNLLSNAIRYNITDGFISLQLTSDFLQISNSGNAQPLAEQDIFKRFYRGNSEGVHHGLGLAIIKQICDISGYQCKYTFSLPNTHSFQIHWPHQKTEEEHTKLIF